ncbi:MAG TPA: hypothetical protein VF382_01190 [Actinomycetota bacterium]
MGLGEQTANALQQVGRDLVATALGLDQLAKPALEVRAFHARTAVAEVPLELGVLITFELPVEVELDLL